MTPRRQLSWKARLSADRRIYCSPACGANCTRFDYGLAVKRAAALCKELGAGWVPRVSENLGWHYSAVSACGRWKVCSDGGSYTAFLGDPGAGGRWAASGKTPRSAIAATWKIAAASIDDVMSFVTARPGQIVGARRISLRPSRILGRLS